MSNATAHEAAKADEDGAEVVLTTSAGNDGEGLNPEGEGQGAKAKGASHMYAATKTWSPFKGCGFGCSYCVPSFQKQAKRQKRRCEKCYRYEPHEHAERLDRIPSSEIVFACGNADVSFCEPSYLEKIGGAIKAHRGRRRTTFYLQSKRPECLRPVLNLLPENVVLVTTLETNRDQGYEQVSKAPPPSVRQRQFMDLAWPRKVVTVEPVMDFDVEEFSNMIIAIRPEYVWLGLNSRDAQVRLPEPSPEKLRKFAEILLTNGIEVRGKHFRGIEMPEGVKLTQG